MHALAILALAGAASASMLESRQTPDGPCARSVHVIAIGGANTPDEYALGLLSTLTNSITAAIPGSDSVSLPYNKVEVAPQMLEPGAITEAVTLLGTYVSEYTAACPNSKIAIIGYSSGASISSLALCTSFTVPQELARNTIIAHVEYGPQTRVAGQPYNLGTCVDGSGTQPLVDPAGCGAYIPLTQSYCDINDPECCEGSPAPDHEIHFVYPGEYDGQATDFVVSQWRKLGGGAAAPAPAPTTKSKTSKSFTKTAVSTSSSKTFVSSKSVISKASTSSTSKTSMSFSLTTTIRPMPLNTSTTSTTSTSTSTSQTDSAPTTSSPSPTESTPPPSDGSGSRTHGGINGWVMYYTAFVGAAVLFGAALL